MRLTTGRGLTAMVLALSVVPAAVIAHDHVAPANDSGLYVAVGGGMAQLPALPTDARLKDGRRVGRDDSWVFGLGWSVTGAIGFDLGNLTRTEAEVSYLTAGIESLAGAAPSEFRAAPTASTMSFMAITRYALDTGSPFRPFLGLGLGAARTAVSIGAPTSDETRLPVAAGHYAGWGGALQAHVGAVYELAPEFAIHLGYRFFMIAPATLAGETGIAKDDPRHADYDTEIVTLPFSGMAAHRFELGVSYRLPLLTHRKRRRPSKSQTRRDRRRPKEFIAWRRRSTPYAEFFFGR